MAFLLFFILPALATAFVIPESTTGQAFESLRPRQAPSIPSYALTYAPLVYLYSGETYLPSDIGAQLVNTQPELNYTSVVGSASPLTLDNLNSSLSSYPGSSLYLTSIDDITANPTWLNGVKPDSAGKTGDAVSCAIIVNDHSSDTSSFVDVFYIYFYAFNYGTFVAIAGEDLDDYPIGNHVGDWEHNMIRFDSTGIPQAVWYSQHDNGEAFTYDCLEKDASGIRPISYSANGSHANYAISGPHSHGIPDINLPIGPVTDETDNGILWDPTLNAYFYSFDAATFTFTALNSSAPTNWLYFTGMWGDLQYNSSDPRQEEILNIPATAKYVSGPTGPEDKQLNRTLVCPDNGDVCIVSPVLRN